MGGQCGLGSCQLSSMRGLYCSSGFGVRCWEARGAGVDDLRGISKKKSAPRISGRASRACARPVAPPQCIPPCRAWQLLSQHLSPCSSFHTICVLLRPIATLPTCYAPYSVNRPVTPPDHFNPTQPAPSRPQLF